MEAERVPAICRLQKDDMDIERIDEHWYSHSCFVTVIQRSGLSCINDVNG